MELEKFLCMNGGDDHLSYSQNSSVQNGVRLMSQSILESAIQSLILDSSPRKVLTVADLGCGVGPVPVAFVSMVIENVQKLKELKWDDKKVPEIQIFLNDLPSNDFNLLFRDLFSLEILKRKDGVPLCYIMATPGSYYAKLFPRKSLHLVHANYTLHWLSKVPPGLYSEGGIPLNKGNIYISETSSKAVAESYLAQFQQDFTQFLKCRSEDMVSEGRVLLTFRGRPSFSNALTWQPWELRILAEAISCLVTQGLIEEDKLDSFDFPYYGACKEEIQGIVEREGSFAVESLKTISHPVAHEMEDKQQRAESIGKFMRAFSEPLISHHFGGDVLDILYDTFIKLMFENLASGEPAEHYTIVVLLKRY